MKNTLIVLLFLPLSILAQKPWDLYIQSDMGEWLSGRISFEEIDGERVLNVINSEETISLRPSRVTEDSIFYRFVDYNAEIAFANEKENTLSGYWINFESSSSKKRAIFAEKQKIKGLGQENDNYDLSGIWRSKIQTATHAYNAMIILEQEKGKIYGTIRTNSGDYRYLEGEVQGNDFYLSSFTGRSIFRLLGEIKNDTLYGKLNSETLTELTISGVKDNDFDLPEPSGLTKVVNDKPFQLDLVDDKGVEHKFADLVENRVSIVSIFGTWCPNCIDETNYLKELRQQFPEIQVILVAFEATDNLEVAQKRVSGFKARKDVDFITLMAGKLGKENVFEKFPMMGSFGGYPTTFLLDKAGNIESVHTGFNGPATGILYDQFKEAQERKIKELLAK